MRLALYEDIYAIISKIASELDMFLRQGIVS